MKSDLIKSYKDLIVWQRSVSLVEAVYNLTDKFPPSEVYGLTVQIRRASTSIPANIAEGRHRGTRRDFSRFLRIAYGSGAELESHLILAKKLSLSALSEFTLVDSLLDEVMRMLNKMLSKLRSL